MLDIVIPTSNRGERIRYTLKSLQASRYAEIKVWVVDQSDDERTADVVRAFARDDARFVLIREKRKGSNHARNVGLRAGNSPIVAFTDDDCLVTPTWAENLLKAYQEDEKAWSVFGQATGFVVRPTQSQRTLGEGFADGKDDASRAACF